MERFLGDTGAEPSSATVLVVVLMAYRNLRQHRPPYLREVEA